MDRKVDPTNPTNCAVCVAPPSTTESPQASRPEAVRDWSSVHVVTRAHVSAPASLGSPEVAARVFTFYIAHFL